MNVGFEIILQWLQSMKRKTCKLSINKLWVKYVMIIIVFVKLFRSIFEIKVIRDYDSFTSPFLVIGPENSLQMQN